MSSSNTFSGKPPNDYQEVLYWRITERTNRILVMNLLSIPLGLIFGLVFFFFIRIFGAKPRYGVLWKGLMFYATAPGYAFPRNQYLIVSLAPMVSLSLLACLSILLQAGTVYVWLWAIWAMTNGSGTIGDLWITAVALRYPEYAYIIDERDGMRVLLPKSEIG